MSKIYHTSDMSSTLAEGISLYEVVYGLKCMKIKDSIAGHHSIQWKMRDGCFKDIHNINAEYAQAEPIADKNSTPQYLVSLRSNL